MQIDFDQAKLMTEDGLWLCLRVLPGAQQAARRFILQWRDKRHVADIKEWRAKRSLDANAYYYKLLAQFAEAIGVSKNYAHNRMLRRYGQPEIMDNQVVYIFLPDTDAARDKADESETYHLKPTSGTKEGKDGITYRAYMLLRGSHTFDTKEMSALVDGLVAECKQLGIETLTPAELARLNYER